MVPVVRRRYARRLAECREAAKVRPIRVAFIVSDRAKWKAQSVVEAMERSGRYLPRIVSPSEGVEGFDIVFYQQPWEFGDALKPERVAKTALTFYIPYFTLNNNTPTFEIDEPFHHLIFGHIVQNEGVKAEYETHARTLKRGYAGSFLPLGHPALDRLEGKSESEENLVIYAPHWTVHFGESHPALHYSTFLENGKLMLEFAAAHPEIKWAFKPHPLLRGQLVKSGAMSVEEVDAYYGAWERIGVGCYDEKYIELFNRSRAMITDCGSFLTEYGATGKPIIRMIHPQLEVEPHPSLKALYATYYETHDNEELKARLEEVVIRGEDPNRAARARELKVANLLGTNAAANILEYLDELLGA